MALSMAAALVCSCGKVEEADYSVEEEYPWADPSLSDTSDIPDWKGSKITVNYWQAHGTGQVAHPKADNDVLTPEVERVTGIVFDSDSNIDNAGQTFDTKLGMLLASKDFPSLATNIPNLGKLVEADVIYDLTELLPKYAPNLMKKYPEWVFESTRVNAGQKGKIYAVPTGVGDSFIAEDEKVDSKKISCFVSPTSEYNYVWVRDDILRKLYPSAHTRDELENIYLERGEFTDEEIFDVPINSKEDFIKMLKDIKALNITENGKPVYATYANNGSDNWSLMQGLWEKLEGRMGAFNHMFTYWDRKADEVRFALDQDFFKADLQEWNQLVRDDVVSKESLIDQQDVFKQKMNNGQYAVLYGMETPDEVALKEAGKDYRYRKVYLHIEPDYERFTPLADAQCGMQGIVIFKNAVKENQLPQILRWIDYMVSDVGEKMFSWGPRSAGLFEEKDGVRRFVDKDVERYVVYGEDNSVGQSYNLFNGTAGEAPNGNIMLMTYKWGNQGIFHPAYMYEKERDKADTNLYYNAGFLHPLKVVKSNIPAIWTYAEKLDSVKKAWDARPSIENALLKILASSDDADFDSNYNDLLSIMKQYGWDEACLKELNERFLEDNKEYMNDIK